MTDIYHVDTRPDDTWFYRYLKTNAFKIFAQINFKFPLFFNEPLNYLGNGCKLDPQ